MADKPNDPPPSSREPAASAREPPAPDPQRGDEPDRLAAPVADEQPPRLPFVVVGVGASAGGLEAFTEFLVGLPAESGMAFVLIVHLSPHRDSMLADLLGRRTSMPVLQIDDGVQVEPNHVYVIRPGRTVTLRDGRLHLTERLEGSGRNHPVDDFFRSLAEEQRERAACVVLSGMGSNGSSGVQAVKAVGGICIAQEPGTAMYPSMPRHLVDSGNADFVLPPRAMGEVLVRLAAHPYAREPRILSAVPQREQASFADVLAILRTRTHQEFGGYKRPTLFRRVQRRMGLNQLVDLADYVRLLRSNTVEVQALADDLLIHVTGFFRDAPAWESLRQQVIQPLVAHRSPSLPIRCWVTACSTGEEAYTLAILLAEAMEQTGKALDVKIFATDMAERSLAQARAGRFPAGIEAEVEPERLERYFEKDDSMYRVRKTVRELVVFAPQNVLQDPPFSRLDIVTCRNLLIYLEPEMQRRVLNLIHFGLRDGGVLLLGTSETASGAEELFEPVDKKWRIYRRTGPTRQAGLDLAPPRLMPPPREAGLPAAPRLTVAQLTERALLQRYTPAAAAIDDELRVAFLHGPTERYLQLPAGEPTRDLMAMCRDSVRPALRAALAMAVENGGIGQARDGQIDGPTGRLRVWIAVAPLELRPSAAGRLSLVTFEEREEPAAVSTPGVPADGDELRRVEEELIRVREELQSTIEELQSSNEELKASSEEVTSTNEELQSANEELETSKEELQSLNEELTTLNAQLQAKNDELQATSSDLTSLLASTDIAVIFLDPRMRIRRFTPAVRDLLDLISSDIGRPLSDLAPKFDDPVLLDDARTVLQKLVPIEAEVRSAQEGQSERWYQRRIMPYRTADDRIGGVVVTFVDVTARRRIEAALRESQERMRRALEVPTVGVVFIDNRDGRITNANDAFLRASGYTSGDVEAGRVSHERITPPEFLADARKAFEELRTRGETTPYAREYLRKDGTRSWGFFAGKRLSSTESVEFVIDINEAKAAERARNVVEAQVQTAVDQVPDLLWYADAGGATRWHNRRWLEYTGLAPAAVLGSGWLQAVHPEDRELTRAAFLQAISRASLLRIEHRLRSASGDYRWFLLQALPGRDADGKVNAWFGSLTDIDDERAAVAALKEGDARFRLVFEGAREFALVLMNADGEVTGWSAGAERLTGYRQDEVLNRPPDFLFVPEDRAKDAPRHELAEARRTGYADDQRWHLRKDGSRFWGSGVTSALRDEGGTLRGFVKVLRDETARKQVEDTLHEAKSAAELANRMKDEFLATLSHELRTPLTSILLWVKMLRAAAGSAGPEYAEAVEAITRSAEAQKQLIDDLLDTSRITSGNLRLEIRPTEFAPVVSSAVEAVQPAAEAKGVTLISNVARDVAVVRADPDRLRQVLWNLLANAIKFTPGGGRVEISARRDGPEVEVRVADTGRGIEASFLPHVFEPFRQADASTTRGHGGLGLGLSICKRLVEQHGGTIEAQSPGLGQGATFVVRLPLPATRRRNSSPPGAARPGKGADLQGLNVLLVEDEAETRAALQKVLAAAGAKVIAVDSAQAALEAIGRERPDVLVSDIAMQEQDGIELIRKVRADEVQRGDGRLAALALTAFARDDDRLAALDAGFDRHVGKPVEAEQLLSLVEELASAGVARE